MSSQIIKLISEVAVLIFSNFFSYVFQKSFDYLVRLFKKNQFFLDFHVTSLYNA